MTTAPPKRTEAETKARRAGIASFIGTTIEWYDFYIYGTASALVFGQVFFSDTLPAGMGTLLAFVTLWAGFLARPIGGIVLDATGCREPVRSVGATAEVRPFGGRGACDDACAGPPAAGVVERLQPRGEMERLRMGRRHGRDQTDAACERCQEGGEQHRVEATAHAIGPGFGRVVPSIAERERVLDRDERDPRVVGGADEVAPVPSRRELARSGGGLAPGGRVPAGSGQRDGEMQSIGHLRLLPRGCAPRRTWCAAAA